MLSSSPARATRRPRPSGRSSRRSTTGSARAIGSRRTATGERDRVIRIFLAGGIALVIALVGTKYLIQILTRLSVGQPIHEDVPEGHTVKAGTPTMGGIAIVVAAVVSYVVSDA